MSQIALFSYIRGVRNKKVTTFQRCVVTFVLSALQLDVLLGLEVIFHTPHVSLAVLHTEHLQEAEESLVALLRSPRLQELAGRVIDDFLLQCPFLHEFKLALHSHLIFATGEAHFGASICLELTIEVLCHARMEHDAIGISLKHQDSSYVGLSIVIRCNVHHRMFVHHLEKFFLCHILVIFKFVCKITIYLPFPQIND